MRRVSLNARRMQDQAHSAEVEVALFLIEHDALDAPLRLSTDPTTRLSTDPLLYGTRSRWMDSDPVNEPFHFIIASVELPGDREDAPSSARIVLENISGDLPKLMRSFTDLARVHMAVVLADTPDVIEFEYRDMVLMDGGGTLGEVSIELSREPIEEESVPVDRITKGRFPGMFR